MPVRVQGSEGLYTLVASGEYPLEELLQCFDHLVSEVRSAEHQRPPGLILDVRDSESMLRRPHDETRQIISHCRPHGRLFASRFAIVVRGHARYGLMRMATTWAALAGYDARVFWDVSTAEAWVRGTGPPSPRRRA